MNLTEAQADTVAEGAIEHARKLGIGITVAVVDTYGQLMRVRRMDNTRFGTIDIARGKCFTAAAFRRPANVMPPLPFFQSAFNVAGQQVKPLIGGVPIKDGDAFLGAVGCAGGSGDQDLECSEAGIAYAKLTPGPSPF
ncbi:MAG TPA: heme-binding protein [Dehalococcoidia bacterium]|nr:heme-binding protein [Dehalococcoidia bacterium]